MLRALPALPSFLLEEKKAKETSVIGLCKFYIAFSRGRRGTALAVDEAYYNVGEGYAGLRSNRGRRRRDGWGSPLPNIGLYRYTRKDLSSFSLPLRGRGTATRSFRHFLAKMTPPSMREANKFSSRRSLQGCFIHSQISSVESLKACPFRDTKKLHPHLKSKPKRGIKI